MRIEIRCVPRGIPPYGRYYVRRRALRWCRGGSEKRGRVRVQGTSRECGVCVCTCKWVGWQSTVVSRDCEQQHQHQLEHQQSRGGVPSPRGTGWVLEWSGQYCRQRGHWHWRRMCCEVSSQDGLDPTFVACGKSSDAQMLRCGQRLSKRVARIPAIGAHRARPGRPCTEPWCRTA